MFRNSNAFLQLIDRQYDDQYRNKDFKIGTTLNIRLPVDYVVGVGATVTPQTTVEQEIPLVVGTQANVAASFTSADFALKIDDFADRYLLKMTNDLAAYVAQDVMSAVNGCPNLVANFSSGAVISPTANTFLSAGAVLDNYSALRNEKRNAILSPTTNARMAATLAGLFNPAPSIAENYRIGAVGGIALGIQDWRTDQTVINHTYGAYGTPSNVNGASQVGSTVTVAATNGPLNVGDIITLPGVFAVNLLTKQSLGSLLQFVVTAPVATSATSISIYPAIVPIALTNGLNTVQYANCTASPTTGQPWAAACVASATIRENLVFRKEAFTLVVADLPLIRNGVVKSARESYDGVSLRMVEGYEVLTDIFVDRVDILYGYTMPKPAWCVIVADAL